MIAVQEGRGKDEESQHRANFIPEIPESGTAGSLVINANWDTSLLELARK